MTIEKAELIAMGKDIVTRLNQNNYDTVARYAAVAFTEEPMIVQLNEPVTTVIHKVKKKIAELFLEEENIPDNTDATFST